MHIESIILHLFEIGAVKFGSFTLKSGLISPIYLDLRLTVSTPRLLVAIGETLHAKTRDLSYDLLCGVPYTALPFATAISIQHNIPMVMRRKEKKEYGTGKLIEGIFTRGQRCLVIEDLVTSGKSILETAIPLQQEGLIVEDAVVLIDREQGGRFHLAEKGIRLHSVCSITTLLTVLMEKKKINEQTVESTLQFIREHQTS